MSQRPPDLNSAQMDALRLAIRSKLEQEGAQELIRDIANRSMEKLNLDHPDQIQPHDVLEDFKKTGILETILSQVNESRRLNQNDISNSVIQQQQSSVLTSKQQKLDSKKRYLYLHIHSGKAFTDHAAENATYFDAFSTLTVHIDFKRQRFSSKSVSSCVEPAFDDSFILDLSKKDGKNPENGPNLNELLSMSEHIHLVVVKHELSGVKSVLSSQYFEWRHLLFSQNGKERSAFPLYGIGSESKIVVGVLDMTLELLPRITGILQKEVVSTQFEIERSRVNERSKRFFNYAKNWWKDFCQIRPELSSRMVKVFAQDENLTTRPVCCFIRPLRCGRLIETAMHAIRFVSVMSYDSSNAIGGNSNESWQSLLLTLVQNKGSAADHANLLCSILIGFGLNAYVCFGTKVKNQVHSWVMTISADGMVSFYESLTGHKFVHDPLNEKSTHPYITVGCVYNNREFYGNIQINDRVDQCTFDLLNESKWKGMDREVLDSICAYDANPFWKNLPLLSGPTINVETICEKFESELMTVIANYRDNLGLNTTFDAGLGYILQPALASYEIERTLGVSVGSSEFQNAIRQYIPDGETFKGCPLQVETLNSEKAFGFCLKSQSCEEIVSCRGDNVRLAVRTKVVVFPENAVSVWIMFACKYRPVL